MNETATLVLAIVGALFTWTSTVVVVVVWLNSQFNKQREMFYKEARRVEDKIDTFIGEYAGRVQRLELLVTGSTLSGEETETVLRQRVGPVRPQAHPPRR